MFGVEYPLSKLDTLVAHDFDAGAMENWGLIAGNEDSYTWDNKTGSLADLQWLVTLQCHELTHQWFGNLVTMDWWSGIWLNEARAVLVASLTPTDMSGALGLRRRRRGVAHGSKAASRMGVRRVHGLPAPR